MGWESSPLALPRPLEPVARENLRVGWTESSSRGRGMGRWQVSVLLLRPTTMPLLEPRSFYLRVARVHLRPSAKLYRRREWRGDSRSAIG